MTDVDQDILARLPHQPPFRFITRLEELAPGEHARALWAVAGDEWFFKGHFPGRPLVPGVLLVEALAQLAGVVGFTSDDSREIVQGRLANVDVRFTKAVTPPAEVVLHAALLRSMGSLCQCQVRAEVTGEVAAHGTLVLAFGGDQ